MAHLNVIGTLKGPRRPTNESLQIVPRDRLRNHCLCIHEKRSSFAM